MIIDTVCLLDTRLTPTNQKDRSKTDDDTEQFNWGNFLTIDEEA